jgi:fibronectin type III domain protein
MLRRLGVLTGAVLASLAFAASAQAAPSTPILAPIPAYVCGSSVTASWTPSAPEFGGVIVGYRLDIGDLTAGTSSVKWTNALSAPITGLINGHQYVVRVRSLQAKGNALTYSWPSGRTFKRLCLILPVEKLKQYVEYNPWPECPMCGLREQLEMDDPVIQRIVATAKPPVEQQFGGMELEADGSVAFR